MQTLSSLTFAIALLASSLHVHAQAGVVNGGFEDKEDMSRVPFWVLSLYNNGLIRTCAEEAKSGSQSMIMEIPAAKPEVPVGTPNAAVNASTRISVEEGKAYTLDFCYKTRGVLTDKNVRGEQKPSNFNVVIHWIRLEGGRVDKDPTTIVLSSGPEAPEWTSLTKLTTKEDASQPYVAPPGAAFAELRFSFEGPSLDHAQDIWVDDVTFLEAKP